MVSLAACIGLIMCISPSVCMFELENGWTGHDEIWFGHYYDIEVKKLEENINLLLSLSFLSFLLFFFVFSLFDIF
jgi:hypothetical protein